MNIETSEAALDHPQVNPWREILQKLVERRVDFVICGGVAVILHGVPRVTKDLDLFVRLEPENIERLAGAAAELGLMPRIPEPIAHLADPTHRRRWMEEKNAVVYTLTDRTGLRQIDVLIRYPIDYETLREHAHRTPMGGFEALLSSKAHLIEAKSAVDPPRKQDLRDIEDLRDLIDHEHKPPI